MNVGEETLRSIGVALIGMAVAISMVGFGVTEPAVAKVRKGCRDQQQGNQTGEWQFSENQETRSENAMKPCAQVRTSARARPL